VIVAVSIDFNCGSGDDKILDPVMFLEEGVDCGLLDTLVVVGVDSVEIVGRPLGLSRSSESSAAFNASSASDRIAAISNSLNSKLSWSGSLLRSDICVMRQVFVC
jgi:hypothetical protein